MKNFCFVFVSSIIVCITSNTELDCQNIKNSIGTKKYGQQQCVCDDQHIWKHSSCIQLIDFFKEEAQNKNQLQILSKNCSKGFFFNITQFQCLRCQNYVFGCKQCASLIAKDYSQISCFSCLAFFYLQNGKCYQCSSAISNCHQCQSKQKCQICINGYQINPDNNSQCLKKSLCNIKSCHICDKNDPNICLKCMGLYQLNQKKDVCSPMTCQLGLTFLGDSCGCHPRHFFNGAFCNLCSQNCESCLNLNMCKICSKGYSLIKGSCVKCSDLTWQQNCSKCYGEICLDCDQGYTLSNNLCILNQLGTQGFYFQDKVQLPCAIGCKSCKSDIKCINCLNGYTFYQQNCYRCSENCQQCYYNQLKNTSICLKCYPQYALLPGSTCVQCQDINCRYCKHQFFCQICVSGFISQNGVCIKCAQNCLSCYQKGPNQCDNHKCQIGFGIVRYKSNFNNDIQICMRCIIGCNKCDQNILNCQLCLLGYFRSQNVNNITICNKCNQNCSKCQNLNDCQLCKFGYILKGGNCIPKCKKPCNQCDPITLKCKSCLSGYKLVRQQCLPDVSCNDTASCIACPQKYIIKQKHCFLCVNLTKNCISCSQNNLALCIKCATGHYYHNNQCIKCSFNCANCLNSKFCYQAAKGYFIQNKQSGTVKKCSQNCKTCQSQSSRCTSCQQYFFLQSSYCQSQKRIYCQIKLGVQKLNFLNYKQIYLSLIQQLSQKLNIDEYNLRFQRFRQGSINFGFYVTIKSQQNPSQILSFVQSISYFQTIAGYKVQNSMVKAIEFIPQYNVKFIYGVWIPITIIILFLLILISCYSFQNEQIYRKLYKSQKEQDNIQI